MNGDHPNSDNLKSVEDTFTFFQDRPLVRPGDSTLWMEGDIVTQQMSDIATTIVRPLLQSVLVEPAESPGVEGSGALTFAVHGRWGSGKTSFIQLVLKEAERQLLAANVDADKLLCCWYNAASFEGASLKPRATLLRHVLLTLAGQNHEQAVSIFRKHIDQLNALEEEASPPSSGAYVTKSSTRQAVNRELQEISDRLSATVGFDDLITIELSGGGVYRAGEQRVMVVVIDDLDRCSRDFAAAILETLQQWGSVPNLFFIVAIDRAVLNDVITQRYGGFGITAEPEVALEKYVQHSIEIPELSEEQVAEYVRRLFEKNPDSLLARAVTISADLFALGLRLRTPRSIKKCLNTISPSLIHWMRQALANSSLRPADVRYQIKEHILQYTWNNFYHQLYVRARGKQNQFSNAIAALERSSSQYLVDDDRDRLEFDLGRVRGRLQVDPGVLPHDDLQLVRFLGAEPWLFLTQAMTKVSMQQILTGIIAASEPEREAPDLSKVVVEPAVQQLERYSRTARLAQSRGDFDTVLQCIVSARQLFVEHGRDVFSANEVVDFGNLALYAERLVKLTRSANLQTLALEMFQNAFELNPRHPNNTMNFISFIVSSEYPPLRERYEWCREQLDEQSDMLRADDPDRWLAMKASLHWVARFEPSWETYIGELVERIETGSSQGGFEYLASFYQRADDADRALFKRAARVHIPRLSGEARNGALLFYADNLDKRFVNTPQSDIAEALEIYRYLLRPIEQGGLAPEWQAVPRRMNAMHNYAVNLVKSGYKREAGRQWFAAYPMARLRNDHYGQNLVRSFVSYLLDESRRDDLASKVQNREEINEIVLSSEPLEIPDEFVPGGFESIFGIVD